MTIAVQNAYFELLRNSFKRHVKLLMFVNM